MRYVPKEPDTNVNVSGVGPLRDFCVTAAKLVGALVAAYIALGLALDIIVPHIPLTLEKRIGGLFARRFELFGRPRPEQEKKLQEIVDRLVAHGSLPALEYSVHIVPSRRVNAAAWPGGHIVVMQPLLPMVESENEVAMVLAHELGHFAHRDHLRGLGRGFVFLVLSSVTFGADSPVSRFIAESLSNVEMQFSRGQERRADDFALGLLYAAYGNAAGATDFLEKMATKEKAPRVFFFFSTHPYTPDRISALKRRIREQGYAVTEKIPLTF